ncbi:MAG: DUF4215 domain-containing protein [Polyangiaceae bacterium]
MLSLRSVTRLLLPFAFGAAFLRCSSTPDVPVQRMDTIGLGGMTGSGFGGAKGDGGTIVVPGGGNAGEQPQGGAPNEDPVCGDGVIGAGEGCDDGNSGPGDGCSGLCKVEVGYDCPVAGQPCVSTVVCGDKAISGNEVCDDGNTVSGDGCSKDCAIEPGFRCDTPGERCVPDQTAECGNGQVEFGETCDDANKVAADGCDAACHREAGFQCPQPGSPCVAQEVCGDGRITTGEVCDDGNKLPGDGCDGVCNLEPFSICPLPGKPCQSTIVCGDGKVVGDEACDDANTVANDGCSADCKQVEPGFSCPTTAGVGGACIPVASARCGDGILSFGEFCDDGNTNPSDGCTATCTVTPGYTCPTAGMACTLVEVCGDKKVSLVRGEECDDGNVVGGDGCTSTCIVETNYSCPTPGVLCTSLVVCGDGVLLGPEQCDDKNVVPGDGCSATCTVEPGWTCPVGGKCRATRCGDGLIAGLEQCDDGGAVASDGCSATCQLEIGFKCSGTPSVCTRTTCGDNTKEGLEQCDDGNTLPFDGCSPTCTKEPACADASGNRIACPASCGDGYKFPSEQCDDGNTRNGDGCSQGCTIEAGFTCASADLPVSLTLPAVYRDFTPGPVGTTATPSTTGHGDFQWPGGSWNQSNPTGTYWNAATTSVNRINIAYSGVITGFARATLGNNADVIGSVSLLGKPVFGYSTATCPLSLTGTSGSWLRRNGNYYCAVTVQDSTSFGQWYTNSTYATTVPSNLTLLRCPRPGVTNDTVCATADANTYLFDSNTMLPNGSVCGSSCDGFFPLDSLNVTKYADCGNSSPNGSTDQHNFHFTSEVRYWFEYQAAANATLTFRGDDDVFVFVNGHLVVDIGGIHGAQERSVTLNATTRDLANTLLGLVDGNIYEIGVFQAERNTCASNYRLQLKNFVLQGTTCQSHCGDGVPTPDEACDRGTANVAPGAGVDLYEKCTTSCTLGPYCGDGVKQTNEACDNGLNRDTYRTSSTSCAAGCKLPPSCGDGNVDGAAGEQCDDGANNANTYGHCSTTCRLQARCGDSAVTNGEECDDGANNGNSSSKCSAACTLKCGNGSIDAGEQCDNGKANNTGGYGKCTATCLLDRRCGDGIKNGTEQCDDGKNDGSYGTCAPGCVFGPRCGDAVIQSTAGEKCDAGDANVTDGYGAGLCTTACLPAPYCGDRSVDVAYGEQCDDGVNSGLPGSCTPDCKGWVPLTSCGDGKKNASEQCDDGKANGTAASLCDLRCRYRCGNGVKDSGEGCDDGVNDGSYGGCNADCTPAGYCGDGVQNGPEQCDLGTANKANQYGPGKCSLACTISPYCGDGRIQNGEECDSTPGCGSDCKIAIPR